VRSGKGPVSAADEKRSGTVFAIIGHRRLSATAEQKGDPSMAFVQIIEFRTSDIDRARQVNDEWWRATEGKRTVRRELLARDRSDPGRCFAVVFFDSFESAMENSELPETQAAAQQYAKMSDGPPVFYDLEVVEDRA
jgi:hypothetical protein